MKALGITAMIIAIVSMFIPLAGIYLTVVAAILAAFAAGPGITFAGVAIMINFINLVFMSPLLWAAQAGAHIEGKTGPGMFLVAVQIIAVIVLVFMHKAQAKKAPQS